MSDTSHEYLTFLLDNEEFGVDILCVQEIMVWSPVTELPGTPDYLKGVINLRGVIVPIVDMRQRFGADGVDYDATTVVIVLRAKRENKSIVVGLVVDAVSDVYKVENHDVKQAPDFGTHINNQFLSGMATVDGKIVIILDAKKLLSVDELYQVTMSAIPQPLAS
ncbi:chemotaxis protein CheW [Candidatus Endobugula sertula]|uniref:Chemotaxis protein CheW n=1 Tax=Candidatus Endobugula sertula TaxID=62101 RepID=A0A1D2QR09_9GAMM|nr:chemotaxis protein CheW [Candidatus Endobugula sertula]